MLVCDGMGGLEAGEVASAIAVETISSCFKPGQLKKSAIQDKESYVSNAIILADKRIKQHGENHPSTKGMGSTVVLAWVIGNEVVVGWCGDSRAYCFSALNGLTRLSHDHSLVQDWVDKGLITEEQAFVHPQSNVITRSLGDPNSEAQPDVRTYNIQDGDIILLCSDGLCGTLRDNDIEPIIRRHSADLDECTKTLWNADQEAGWHDNVTTALAQVSITKPISQKIKREHIYLGLLIVSVLLNVLLLSRPTQSADASVSYSDTITMVEFPEAPTYDATQPADTLANSSLKKVASKFQRKSSQLEQE